MTFFCYGVTFLVYIAILLWGILGNFNNDDWFGYGLFSFYLIMPIVSFVCAATLGIIKTPLKWIYPFLFGVFGFLVSILVAKRVPNIPLMIYFLPSIAGLAIGVFIGFIRNKCG